MASTQKGAWILDPFTGSSTTGISANLLERKFLGIDLEKEYLDISINRRKEIENHERATLYKTKIRGFYNESLVDIILNEPTLKYGEDLKI